MSRIRSKGTKPELLLKKELRKLGFTYQPKLLGKPDFADKKRKIAVFIDGCFWHKCPKCYKEPATRKGFWLPKIKRNAERDKEVNKEFMEKNWKILRIWEHEIKNNAKGVIKKARGRCCKS